jgi:hypothetical protein
MFARPWFAILLFIGYLLMAGTGVINAPETPRFAVAESHAHQVHHHQDRYADFDGLDLGLDELADLNLTINPNQDTNAPADGASLLKITGIDAHCLPTGICFSFLTTGPVNERMSRFLAVALTVGWNAVDAPPW